MRHAASLLLMYRPRRYRSTSSTARLSFFHAEHRLIATLVDVLADVFDRLHRIAVFHIDGSLEEARK